VAEAFNPGHQMNPGKVLPLRRFKALKPEGDHAGL
jgi:hypothetical protein